MKPRGRIKPDGYYDAGKAKSKEQKEMVGRKDHMIYLPSGCQSRTRAKMG